MKKFFLLSSLLICAICLFGQKLPVFLKSDSVQTAKIIRQSGDSVYQTQFIQQFEFSYVETVITLDSICDIDTCYPTDFETLRVILTDEETASVAIGNDTIVIVGSMKNLNECKIPYIDINPDSLGDEYFIWSDRIEQYCDTFPDKNGQTRCLYCGNRRIFDILEPETTQTAIILHKYTSIVYPDEDTCRCGHIGILRDNISEIYFSVEENGLPIGKYSLGQSIPVNSVIDGIIPESRRKLLSPEPLLGVRYNPESLLVTPGTDTIIVPFIAIDGSWEARFKWLWDDWAGPNETYTGYISYWDEIPWGQIDYRDVGPLQLCLAAPAQYIPTYAGDTIGYVDSIIAILDNDNIANDSIYLCYPTNSGQIWGWISLKEIFYKDFDTTNTDCPIVFSRPIDTLFMGVGNLCDNAHQAFFCRDYESCESTEGMRQTGINYDTQYFADAIHFYGRFNLDILSQMGVIPYTIDQILNSNPKLIVYTIGTGSVPRIWLNGTQYIVSPGYFPSYGDPYNFVYNGHKSIIDNPNILYDGINEIEVELIAPRPEDLGAQVVFALRFVLPETTEYIKKICKNNIIDINQIIYRGTEIADSGNTADTAIVSNVDTNSAVIVFQSNGNTWQSGVFSIVDSSIIIKFPDTLTTDRLWRWWYFTGKDR
ncbi:hypothetical protein J7L68_07865 [bacterium]|nr:hypothetical protein [bacterium]